MEVTSSFRIEGWSANGGVVMPKGKFTTRKLTTLSTIHGSLLNVMGRSIVPRGLATLPVKLINGVLMGSNLTKMFSRASSIDHNVFLSRYRADTR